MILTSSDLLNQQIESLDKPDMNGNLSYSNNCYWAMDDTNPNDMREWQEEAGSGGGGGGTEKTKLSQFENDMGYVYVSDDPIE